MSKRATLFVAGFSNNARARDLAYEFERYGRLVRCDIPAPRNYSSKPYAFVEFEDPRDAEDAFNEMHGRRLDGYTLNIQWAKNAPSSSWRYDRRSRSPGGSGRSGRHRSLSPRRSSRRHSPSPSPRNSRSRSRSHSPRGRSHSPHDPPRPEGDDRRGSQNVDGAEASVDEDRPMPLAEGAAEGDAHSPENRDSRSTSPKREE